ncbi:hypothetical protein LEP1GSC061_2279 [Leptospira wolffii serovar Khorat str. Khorat-H2]|nr:hypothetical protein LEP1GSC061_2279 [Leptospira wolffii serovar Khorat str. Khorat-H2]
MNLYTCSDLEEERNRLVSSTSSFLSNVRKNYPNSERQLQTDSLFP